MKKWIPLALLLFISLNCIGQADSTVSLIAYWEIGDSATYRITKTVTETKNDSTTIDTTFSTISFNVINSTSNSYEIEWIYNDVSLDMFDQILPELELGNSSEKLTIKYLTDEFGAFKSVTNYKEIEAFYTNMFSDMALLFSITDSSLKKDELELVFNNLFDKELLQNSYLKEIQYFHSLFGGIYDLMDTLEYISKSPPVFGNKTIRTEGILYADTVYPDENIFVMINEEILDQEDSKRVVGEFLKEIDISKTRKEKRKKRKEFEQIFDKAKLEIYKYELYQYEYNYGYPLYIYGESEVHVDIEGSINYKKQVIELELL